MTTMTPETRLAEGCQIGELRPFLVILDGWGGDAHGNPTAKLRCICSFKKNGNHVMVGDHMWIGGADARGILDCKPSIKKPIAMEQFGQHGFRPKRGTKFFVTAECMIYAPGKAKICNFERVEPLQFVEDGKQLCYWVSGMQKDTTSALWHGG